jgi:hypothetical protein
MVVGFEATLEAEWFTGSLTWLWAVVPTVCGFEIRVELGFDGLFAFGATECPECAVDLFGVGLCAAWGAEW